MLRGRNEKIIEYVLPPVVTGILFLIILAMGGFRPFGKDTIDYYDMAQQAEAYYYHNFDQLHGLKSFVFDWYTNLGRGIPGLSEPSVYDILLYVIPRSCILEAMSLMMMVKIMAAAFFMGLFIKYVNSEMPYIFRLMVSAGYGLCGFVLVNYTIPQWIDMASFVPLVLMFSQKALKEGKILGLSVSVFLISAIDTYFSIQMLVMMFFIGGLFLVFCFSSRRKTGEKKDLHVFAFGIGTALGIGLSAFSFIPDIAVSMSSARFDNGSSGGGLLENYMTILRTVQPAYLSRWFALLSLAFPAAVAATGMIKKTVKKQYSQVVFYVLCILFPVSQLFLESIHLILHFGSYVNYPVRNSFMIYCIISGIATASYEREKAEDDTDRVSIPWLIASGVAAACAAFVFKMIYSGRTGTTDHDVLIFTMGFMALGCIIHFFLLRVKKSGARVAALFLWATELLVFGIIMIGKPAYDTPYGNDPEQEGEYIRIADQLVSGFGENLSTGKEAATCRIKNPDTSLNTNYGMIMRRETLAGWTGYATADLIEGAVSLGYGNQYTRLLDSGGNIFSDTMLHITDVIGTVEADEMLYENAGKVSATVDHLTQETKEYHLSHNRFRMPFAIPVTDIGAITDPHEDIVDTMNAYAKGFGAPENIASYISVSGNKVKVEGKKALYLVGGCADCEYKNTKITVNGKVIKIPSIGEIDNEYYPAHFNNNCVALGTFENEEVSIIVDTTVDDPDEKIDSRIYGIDLDVLRSICDGMPEGIDVFQGKRSLDIRTIDIEPEYDGLLIPVPYSDGWSAVVNGRSQTITPVNGLFMYVPVQGGANEIRMSYIPPYMIPGIIVSVISVALVIILTFLYKKKNPVPGRADTISGIVYVAAFGVAVVLVYAVPVIYAVLFRMG